MRTGRAQFAEEVRATLPPDAAPVDVHTHLGVDEDGRSLAPEALVRQLDEAGVVRACVFPLHDPERRPAYRTPNDRVLEWAGTDGRFVPFCRLDPFDGAVAEAERCLARGARGIKLHPRAQAFTFDGSALDGIFRVAEEAGVPILIHAGRGLPPIAAGLCDVALRHPGAPLILAHGGIADMGAFTQRLAGHPAAFFDTSVFSPLDMLELLARVPPERIVFGSDPPYGRVLLGLFLTVRAAVAAGADHGRLRAITGATAQAILDGTPPAPPSAPLRSGPLTLPVPLLRVATYLMAAFPAVLRGEGAGREYVDLALATCRDPAPGPAEPALARIEEVLATVEDELGDPASRTPVDLVYLALTLAVTEPTHPI